MKPFYKNITLLLVSSVLPLLSHATSWPVFSAPDSHFLLNNNYIDTHDCPAGYGRLISESQINIHQSLCKTFCPDNWAWVAKSDNACHDLKHDFVLQKIGVWHKRDANGTVLYSKVIAFYGADKKGNDAFKFKFVTPAEHWDCYENNQDTHTLSCANDI